MPFFSTNPVAFHAKNGVVSDGEVFTVGTGVGVTPSGVSSATGASVSSTLSMYSAFHSNPVRGATAAWSVQMKDVAFKVLDIDIKTMVPSYGAPLNVQLQPTSVASGGQLVINWVFTSASGTPTDILPGGQFLVFVEYAETSF